MSAVPKLADKKSLRNLVPLNGLSNTHFEELARKAKIIDLSTGKLLFKKGERDNATCYVLSGEIALHDGTDIKLTIQGGTEEARHPIAPQQPRQLSARAKTPVTIVSIDSGLLDVMLSWEQSSGYEVTEVDADEEEDWMTRMMQSELMQRLPATNLQQLFMRMQEAPAEAGEVIVNQDDEGDYYYIIKEGKCIVSRRPSANAKSVKLAELTDGDSFGEESLLSGARRNATVTMLTKGRLMRLSKNDFNELLKSPLLSQVSYDEAKELIQDGAVILDVRLPGEYSNAHLKDSINVPLAAIRNEISGFDLDKPYVVYCDTGRRSTSAVFLLGQFGIDAHVLKDGLSGVPLEEYTEVQKNESDEQIKSIEMAADVIDINREKELTVSATEAANSINVKLEQQVSLLTSKTENLKKKLKEAEARVKEGEQEVRLLQNAAIKEKKKESEVEEVLIEAQNREVELIRVKEQLVKAESQVGKYKVLAASVEDAEILGGKIERLKELLLSEQTQKTRMEEEVAALKEKFEKELAGSHENTEDIQRQFDENQNTRQGLESELASSGATIELLKKNTEELESQLNVLNEKLDSEVKSGTDKLVLLEEELRQEKQELTRARDDLAGTRTELEGKESELKTLREGAESEVKSGTDKLVLLEEELRQEKQELARARDDLAGTRTELEGKESELKALREGAESEGKSVSEKLGSLGKELKRERQELTQTRKDLTKARKDLESHTVEIKATEEAYQYKLGQVQSEKEQLELGFNKELKELRRRLAESGKGVEKQLSVLQREVEEAVSARNKITRQLDETNRKLDGSLEDNARLESEQGELKNELGKNKDKLASVTNDLNRSKEELENSKYELGRNKDELENARNRLSQNKDELENARNGLSQNKDELENARNGLSQIKDELENARNELSQNKDELENARNELSQNNSTLAEKEKERNGINNELAALRAIYAQKESEITLLQKELDESRNRIGALTSKDGDIENGRLEAEQGLKLVKQEYEQAANESREKTRQLEKEIEQKDREIIEANRKAEEAISLRTDAESSFTVMESEARQINLESEGMKKSLSESEEKLKSQQAELESLKKEKQEWLDSQNDAGQKVDANFLQSRINELEAQLKDSQNMMAESRDSIRKFENDLSMERHKSDRDNSLQTQIEKLKREMEEQLENYKSEIDDDAVSINNENEKLRDELKQLYKEQEIAIETGKPVTAKRLMPVREPANNPAPKQPAATDHSALFDLPDIDKNLFSNNATVAAPKSKLIMFVVVSLFLSIVSAGGVYWYFVLNNGGQGQKLISAGNESVTEPDNIPAAGSKKDNPARKVARKSLFNFDKKMANTPKVALKKAGKTRPTKVFRDTLKAGGRGPYMAGAPAGVFNMGSPSSSVQFEERPEHTVKIRKFSISKYEISFDEYDRFVADTGRPRPSDSGWGRGKRPVINVSWNDAVAYTKWLSRQTGRLYRLPSEAEWEYAARAGTKGKYWWGNKVGKNRANCFNCGSQWDRASTAPVGKFRSNALGLHDMAGNVAEWVSDCYHENYKGAPADGSAWVEASCDSHVTRGGSYRSTADNVRVTGRSGLSSDSALDQLGFRIVRVR
ncbi:MAG TPA: cyclic nucleotide-binding domain-containing protein [Gammaproteobacteria bacterium]|nr:cyclic nucleotide-binding domain-containing protein [Gammaproteobacteria bacterium]